MAGALLLALAPAAASPAAPSKARLKAFVQAELDRIDPTPQDRSAVRWSLAWADLKGNGGRDALIYVIGPDWCGSGGCTLLIAEPSGNGYRLRGNVSVVQNPIGVLPTRHQGWRDVAVGVAGGGITSGYEAALPFDGRRYADNPTVAPARPLRRGVKAKILIDSDALGSPLWPGAAGPTPSPSPRH
ncbi:MAG: hypothetical protein ACREEX_00175 [Caulobacteraceae bacterium]